MAKWGQLLTVFAGCAAIVASLHAVLHKRDSNSAVSWVALIWLSPLVGPLLYLFFGINRVQRRARQLRSGLDSAFGLPSLPRQRRPGPIDLPPNLQPLLRFMNELVPVPLTPGNLIEPLENAEQAYPAMLEAIDQAQASVTFSTYIFERDPSGLDFSSAFIRARERGVEVRVLVDHVGAMYGSRGIIQHMRRGGVPVRTFLPTTIPGRFWHWNLRNHRKLLIVDGRTAFTGGMNVRHRHYVSVGHPQAVSDVHFRVRGPVVAQLQQAFVEDWAFTCGEVLAKWPWFAPELDEPGTIWARAIPDGPDEDLDKQRHTLHGAIACARKSLVIVTPFFLPDPGLITALNVAAMRGVIVDILVPACNHTRFVQWASMQSLRQLLYEGCRVWLTPPPFDHSKLFVVDDIWAHIGSGNWDPRSLRLNFELNVECYGTELAVKLREIADRKRAAARPLSIAEIDARSLPVKLRDGIARLCSPFL